MSSKSNTTMPTQDKIMQEKTLLHKQYCMWLASLVFAALSYGAAYLGGISPQGCAFFALTILAVSLWGFALLDDGLVAVMLPMGYILTGVGTPKQILAPWTQPMGWLILGGLMTGLVLMHTGLAKRIALWSLHIVGGSFVRLLWGVLLAGFIIAPLMPTALGKGILLSIICIGVCDALGFKAKSREASTVLIAGCIAVCGPRLGLYTGAGEVTLNMQMLLTAGVDVSWFEYLRSNYIPSAVYSILSMLVLLLVMRPKTSADAAAYVEEQYAALGPMSLREKKASFLFVVLTALMMTDKYHGINIGWLMMLVGFVGFLPGINLIDSNKFKTINLTAVLFVVGCMSIGAGAQATGMDKLIAQSIMPILQGNSEMMTLVYSFLAGVGLNFLLTPVAAVSTFTVPLVEIARSLDMNPVGLAYAFIYGLDQYVLPYEYSVFLFFFSTGYISFKYLVQVFALRALMALALIVVFFYPFWKFTGAL